MGNHSIYKVYVGGSFTSTIMYAGSCFTDEQIIEAVDQRVESNFVIKKNKKIICIRQSGKLTIKKSYDLSECESVKSGKLGSF